MFLNKLTRKSSSRLRLEAAIARRAVNRLPISRQPTAASELPSYIVALSSPPAHGVPIHAPTAHIDLSSLPAVPPPVVLPPPYEPGPRELAQMVSQPEAQATPPRHVAP
ncbi:hypothetical protein DACRYDRAFT_25538 [Dacryopinax primogenitus]|uniref:Uncharacterized protein n=1 Tax=Dacryopinax primogenitus (strain DJM 731) TaxID=1858805 RepID=M5FU29_DACPD|nr:uncharacterized protein DACRYDRAFT_25538 [Dacryopinax primogenitus]EJT96716.1 hypothetical protein DACRYDRAFT_25538 [Dacryopinax primogenitus]